MYISQLRVRGFHSLQDVSIQFRPGLNVLVGKNNSGKSNIIRAIDYLLGEKWPTYQDFDDRCFYRDANGQVSDLSIIVELSGKGINRFAIEDLNRNQRVYRTEQPLDLDQLEGWLQTIRDQRYRWMTCGEITNALEQANQIYIYLLVPKRSRRNERDFGLIFLTENRWHYCSFSGDLRDALITTAFIPAFRDPTAQLRPNPYNWYGKLIREIYNRRTDAQELGITQAQSSQTEILAHIFRDATTELRTRLSQAVFHHRISFQAGANTTDDGYKQITVFVDDGVDAPYYEKGSGIQSALILGLFSYYCKEFHKGSSLLLVEEPEIYLHPQARRSIEAQLNEFVREGVTNGDHPEYMHQVIVSTHSPEFLRSVEIPNLCVVRKEPGCTATSTRQSGDTGTRERQIIETKNAEMFFADHVILVEGGEEYILPPLADLFLGKGEANWLDVHNFSVARVNGKGQFKAYTQLLDHFGIGWTVLTDLDFLRNGVEKFSDHLDKDAQDALSRIVQTWQALSESVTPRGRKIKNNLFDPEVRDWQKLYQDVELAIQEICSGRSLPAERIETIERLWDSLKDRVANQIDYRMLFETNQEDIEIVLDRLKSAGIFVLPLGELEDHLPEQALEAIDMQGKDRCALTFSRTLSERPAPDWVMEWINSPDARIFSELLFHIQEKAGVMDESEPVFDEPVNPFDEIPF